MKHIMTAAAALAAALSVSPALAQWASHGPYYGHGDWAGGWGHSIFGLAMMVVFWGGLILLVVLAVRWIGGGRRHGGRERGSALDILEDRFARGEIDAQEFEDRKRTLGR